MSESNKIFLKKNFHIDTDSINEEKLKEKLIDIINRNNKLISLKKMKNKMLTEKLEKD